MNKTMGDPNPAISPATTATSVSNDKNKNNNTSNKANYNSHAPPPPPPPPLSSPTTMASQKATTENMTTTVETVDGGPEAAAMMAAATLSPPNAASSAQQVPVSSNDSSVQPPPSAPPLNNNNNSNSSSNGGGSLQRRSGNAAAAASSSSNQSTGGGGGGGNHRRGRSGSSRDRRRRSYSDVPKTIEGIQPPQYYQQQYNSNSNMMMGPPPPPPPYGGYPPSSPYNNNNNNNNNNNPHQQQQHQQQQQQQQQPYFMGGSGDFYQQQQQQQSQAYPPPPPYGRGRAWSGDGPSMYGSGGDGYPMPPPPPPQGYSGAGGGYSSGGEGRPLLSLNPSFDNAAMMTNSGAPPPRPHHRRLDSNGSVASVSSGMGGGGGYGSTMIMGGPPASPRPTPASPRSHHQGAEFSPRHEFLNMMMRPESPRSLGGGGGGGGGGSSLGVNSPRMTYPPQASPRGMYPRQTPIPPLVPPPPGIVVGGGSYSPHPSSYSSAQSAAMAAAAAAATSGMVMPSPGGGGSRKSYRGGGGGEAGGGEAIFSARQNSLRNIHSGNNNKDSSRRRHMRQQSAQIYMEQVKGTPQPPMCRDLIFLLLFAFHLTGMVYLSNEYSKEALFPITPTSIISNLTQQNDGGGTTSTMNNTMNQPVSTDDANAETSMTGNFTDDSAMMVDESSVTINYPNLLLVAICTGAFAMAVSTTLLGVMTYFARRFISVALVVIIGLSFVWGTVGIGLSPKNIVPITGIIALALSVAYAILVWERIPFAASNLLTALSAVRAFPGTLAVALFFQALGCGWCIYYAIIVIGIYDSILDGRIVLSERMTLCAYIILGISFYWTYQVLLNAVQVATATVIGNWWYQPDGQHAVTRSSFMTLFYSMGSVCFGSLFVGPVLVIRQLAVLFRPSTESSLLCLHECLQCFRQCITSCVDELAARFNPWAFTYVGLYGYGFLEAGQLATEVFDKRGWTTIVSDDLVRNLLLMTSVVVGGVSGCFGFILSGLERLDVTTDEDDQGLVAFVAGLIIGWVITSILFGAISSSVNAVIVCFATSPVDFAENHPELSRDMRAAWREVWPGALDIVDMHVAMAQQQQQDVVMNGSFRRQQLQGPMMNFGPGGSDPSMTPLL